MTGVQTCALPIWLTSSARVSRVKLLGGPPRLRGCLRGARARLSATVAGSASVEKCQWASGRPKNCAVLFFFQIKMQRMNPITFKPLKMQIKFIWPHQFLCWYICKFQTMSHWFWSKILICDLIIIVLPQPNRNGNFGITCKIIIQKG